MTPAWHNVERGLRSHFFDATGDSVCGTWHFRHIVAGEQRPKCETCARRENHPATATGAA